MPEEKKNKIEELFRSSTESDLRPAGNDDSSSRLTLRLTGSWEMLHPNELVRPKIFTSTQIASEQAGKTAEPEDGSMPEEEADENDALIGTVLTDRYEILDVLGHGGMSVVYKAKQVGSDQVVALKKIRVNSAEDIMRFSREIRSHSRLRHKNIVEYMEFIATSAGEFFLVMERVKGLSLLDIMCSVGRIEAPDNVASIMIQACDALAFAHRNGVIHRDLKSSNIILVREDDSDDLIVKILDFGIARVEGEGRITFTGRAVGSPVYMSPEQCRAKTMTALSDIYSICVVAYEIITGEAPYSDGSIRDIMAAHCNPNKRPTPIDELVPELPGAKMLDQIIQKGLQTDPAKRWQNATQLKEAFEFWVNAVQEGRSDASLPDEMLEQESAGETSQEVYLLSTSERDQLREMNRGRSTSIQITFSSGTSVDSGVHKAEGGRPKAEFFETQSLRAQQADLQLSIEEVKKNVLMLSVVGAVILIALGIFATFDAKKLQSRIWGPGAVEETTSKTGSNGSTEASTPDASADHPGTADDTKLQPSPTGSQSAQTQPLPGKSDSAHQASRNPSHKSGHGKIFNTGRNEAGHKNKH